MDTFVEITRIFYHLDLTRRHLRQLHPHLCNDGVTTGNGVSSATPCIIASFKDLFQELNLSMRESVLDPPLIRGIIETKLEPFFIEFQQRVKSTRSHLTVPQTQCQALGNPALSPSAIYEFIQTKLEGCLENSCSSPIYSSDSPIGRLSPLNLKSEYSLTKICLQCRTTTHTEAISKWIHQVDSTNLISSDWPSFEFGLKCALDSGEFCVKPNCHGQTKIFRCLRAAPLLFPIYFTDSQSVSVITLLPSRLRPCLIFESSSTSDLSLLSLVVTSPEWGTGCIFFHTRLGLWIFIDSRRVLPLFPTWIESRFHPILSSFRVLIAFYGKVESGIPPLPCRPSAEQIYANYTAFKPTDSDGRIYENWPLDSDSGRGSEELSSSSSTAPASSRGMSSGPWSPPNSKSAGISRKMSNTSSSTSNTSQSSNRILKYRQYLDNNKTISDSILPRTPEAMDTSSSSTYQKYATIRRKIKYVKNKNNGGSEVLHNNYSLSVPDLRVVPPGNPSDHRDRSRPSTPSAKIKPYIPITSVTSLQLTSNNNTGVLRFKDRDEPARPRDSVYSNGSSVCSSKKVSFNCQVTLVDDVQEEYIPHPIFQSVIEKLHL